MKLRQLFQPSNSQGVKSEQQALTYLLSEGLSLVCQNYNCRFGEIDLIMLDQDTLVFIEVRYRKNNEFGGALASITKRKQSKIIKAAKHFVAQLDEEPYCRFDAIAIQQDSVKPEWIENAFIE